MRLVSSYPRPQPQFWLYCRSCGAPATLLRGFCARCYAAQRRDSSYFGGFRRQVLARDGHRCRVCGQPGTPDKPTHVHHRRPGVSRETLLIALCPAHHALIHRLRVLDRLLPDLARALWRELHPSAPEQLPLCFPPLAEAPAQQDWLWEQYRAG